VAAPAGATRRETHPWYAMPRRRKESLHCWLVANVEARMDVHRCLQAPRFCNADGGRKSGTGCGVRLSQGAPRMAGICS